MLVWDQTLIDLFQKGGFAMWPLLACSIIGTAIIAERFVYFMRLRFDYSRFLSELKEILRRKEYKEAILFSRKKAHPVPHLAAVYLENLQRDDLRSEILKREGSLALEKIETRLRGLAVISHISPLLGLLGTVTGLVAAFHQIELRGGQVQPGDLASGIWEALITTVFGLVIAIPCMASYHGFESKADRAARQMQFLVSELDEFFGKQSSKNFRSEDVEKMEEQMKAMR